VAGGLNVFGLSMALLIGLTFPRDPLTSVQLTLRLGSSEGHGDEGQDDEEELKDKVRKR